MYAGYEGKGFCSERQTKKKVNKKGWNFRFSTNMPKVPKWVMKQDGIIKTQKGQLLLSLLSY